MCAGHRGFTVCEGTAHGREGGAPASSKLLREARKSRARDLMVEMEGGICDCKGNLLMNRYISGQPYFNHNSHCSVPQRRIVNYFTKPE